MYKPQVDNLEKKRFPSPLPAKLKSAIFRFGLGQEKLAEKLQSFSLAFNEERGFFTIQGTDGYFYFFPGVFLADGIGGRHGLILC